jgi:hypothetical protein
MDENIIEIGFSGTQNSGQIDLSGSPKALQFIGKSIINLVHDREKLICVVEAAIFNPTPYDICLKSLSICKSNTLIKILVLANSLYIQGSQDTLAIFASWLLDFDDTWCGHHRHIDYYEGNEWIDPRSIPLVISVKNSIARLDFLDSVCLG